MTVRSSSGSVFKVAAARLSRSSERPAMVTDAPSDRASRAVSNPMPELPPMTTTRWLFSRITIPFRLSRFSARSSLNLGATVP
jgi:hypothetical protein